MSDDHEALIGMHLHDEELAGLEIACSCGDVLHIECDKDALLALSEIKAIAERHCT